MPCSLCGGDDRFHIGEKPNGEALIGIFYILLKIASVKSPLESRDHTRR